MLRHEFQPGRLVAGGFLTLAGGLYAGDAGGLWDTPWFAVIPLVVGGLCLAALAGTVAQAVRGRRRKVPAGDGEGGHARDLREDGHAPGR
ncbi:hypothetical protein [Streptomyces fructofermentans]|uniref:Uncharacterized protein n=1 Tax=Streptomyces fructofermentans TaxID=152141 RepID=A0A918JYZ2_9ACTN|nr:hypothetical protein [Streptomyces fructofermentans]GGX38436.1 hypothetical protein GCM10010515_00800 [Streptomyces fructofermentans]